MNAVSGSGSLPDEVDTSFDPKTFPLPRKYSVFDPDPEIAKELDTKLNAAEREDIRLPALSKADISDSAAASPWARKLLLCLDGGGIKGYSSLLILKRLTDLIEEIETGVRRYNLPKQGEAAYYEPNHSSEDYPWYREYSGTAESSYPQVPITNQLGSNIEQPNSLSLRSRTSRETIEGDETDKVLKESVQRCFADPKPSNFKICHYFDYIAGTSTGGLSAILLGRMEMPVQTALEQYDVVGNLVFGQPRRLHSQIGMANFLRPKYPSRNMEKAIIQVIEKGLEEELVQSERKAADAPFQSDPRRCRTMVLAHGPSANQNVIKRTHIFRTYDHPNPSPAASRKKKDHLNPGSAHSHEIWKIARATSAAPKYFSPMEINERTYRDGGMGANNPAKAAFNEVLQLHDQPPRFILSIGTGQQREKVPLKKEKLGLVKNWRDVGKAMTRMVAESEETHSQLEDDCERRYKDKYEITYKRLNVPEPMGNIRLDEWLPPQGGNITKDKIIQYTIIYLSRRSVHLRLVECARILVKYRRARSATERWETFARKFVYFCPEQRCLHRAFTTRDELRDHAIYEHSFVCSIKVKNHPEFPNVCLFDHCAQSGISIFQNQSAFQKHLRESHSIEQPVFMNRRRMEAWLDEGRHTVKQAVARQDSPRQDDINPVDLLPQQENNAPLIKPENAMQLMPPGNSTAPSTPSNSHHTRSNHSSRHEEPMTQPSLTSASGLDFPLTKEKHTMVTGDLGERERNNRRWRLKFRSPVIIS